MKLLFCTLCENIVKLQYHTRFCLCKKSSGKYLEDGLHAEIRGEYARTIGFSNPSFLSAFQSKDRDDGKGNEFVAFVIPRNSKTVKEK